VKRKKKSKTMAYLYRSLTADCMVSLSSRQLIQTCGNFAGQGVAEWYVSLTICEGRDLAEDLALQIGTTVK
jgi:hypothetical protein